MIEKTYVMVKPDFANKQVVIREVVKRLQAKGLKIELGSYLNYTEETAKLHYHEHVGRPYYNELEEYITSDKAYGMVVKGENAVAIVRELCGATKNPAEGTIRYDIPLYLSLPCRVTQNVVHSSDSVESAKNEIAIFHSIIKKKQAENGASL